MNDYLEFRKNEGWSAAFVTDVWDVISKRSGDRLGLIRWYAPWRQYTFRPDDDTVWNHDCLRLVADKCVELTKARREERAA